jgi:hypothetical protein
MNGWKELAAQDGWRVDELCKCAEPAPVIVGGSGYCVPPLLCLNCRRVVAGKP